MLIEKDSVNKILKDIVGNLAKLSPKKVSDYAVKLSVYRMQMSETLANSGRQYYIKLCEARKTTTTDGMAMNIAMATDEYYDKVYNEKLFESVTELILSLKKRLGVLENEAKGLY